jgi:hypothetical protein
MPGFLEPIWETIFRVATWSALIFGAFSIGSAFVSAWVGWEITDATQKDADHKIKAADERIKNADLRIAEFNARAKEAEFKLEELRRQVAPRSLKRDVLIKILEGQPKAPTEIMYLRDDAESFELAQQIALAMEAAGWQITSRLPIPPTSDPQAITAMAVGGQPSGVTVVVGGITQEEEDASLNAMQGKEWIKTPWTVLTHALGESLGKISGRAGGQNAPPEGSLRVVVSPRL